MTSEEAYTKGQHAALDGFGHDMNPFSDACLRQSWSSGWSNPRRPFVTPPEVGGELVERGLSERELLLLSDFQTYGAHRRLCGKVWRNDLECDCGYAKAAAHHQELAALSTPEVVDGTAGLVEALGILDEFRSTLSADYLDRVFGPDMKQRIDRASAALSQHRRP